MKKIFLSATGIACLLTVVKAQTPEDALKYSRLQAPGSARVQALGGASGALGGEVSTLFTNPANLGFYKSGDAVISAGLNLNSNKTTFYNGTDKSSKSSGFLGTTGVVFGKPTYGNGSLVSAAFSVGVSRLADFNNKTTYSGLNADKTSRADAFIQDIKYMGHRDAYGSQLAFDTYWIDTTAGGNYISPAATIARAGGLIQQQTISTSGGISELAIGGGLNFNDKVYVGATLGLPMLRYEELRDFIETDPNDNPNNQFDYGRYKTKLITEGEGINLKLGVVITPTDHFRIGLAGHSPTFYSIKQTYDANAEVNSENYPREPQHQNSPVVFSEPSDVAEYDYKYQSPYKFMASFTGLFGNLADPAGTKGLLTGDVEYTNYMASRFRNYNYNDVYDPALGDANTAIKNAYQGALNARLGGEVKVNTMAFRLGGAYYGNPYNTNVAGEKSELYQATGGLGYRNRGFYVDLGYSYTFGKESDMPYRLQKPLAISPAVINPGNSRVMVTVGFKI